MLGRTLIRNAFVLFATYGLLSTPLFAAEETTVQCDAICGPTESCETECQNDLWDTTCGNYNGGSSSGQCEGFCGDYYCNAYSGENSSTCSEDCEEPVCEPDWDFTGMNPIYGIDVDEYCPNGPSEDCYCTVYFHGVQHFSDLNECEEPTSYCGTAWLDFAPVPQGTCDAYVMTHYGVTAPWGDMEYCWSE